jgi:hypothetical protein
VRIHHPTRAALIIPFKHVCNFRAVALLTNVDVYKAAELLPLSFEFQYRSASLLFAIVKLRGISNLSSLFQSKLVCRLTRESDAELMLQIPFTTTERERSAFSWWGCILWHRIPAHIRNVDNLKEFQLMYKRYLSDQLVANVNLHRKFYAFV